MTPERITTKIFKDDKQASQAVAQRIADLIRKNNAQAKATVLGLATGRTPVNVYKELIHIHQKQGLDFANVITFNLDEYWPIDPRAIQSYHTWMQQNFFQFVNIIPANIHIPKGDIPEEEIEEHCKQYENSIASVGGIDFQLLGIGRSGHIGFNEPGTHRDSRTRCVHLDKITRKDAASDFFGEQHVPKMAITMGIGTILEAREIAILAFGEHKAHILKKAVEEKASAQIAASFLQEHSNAVFYADLSAAAELTRIATPWLLTRCKWDDILQRKAVIWLSRKLNKAVSKLTNEDYADNGLVQLLQASGPAEKLNAAVFRLLIKTITNHPAGENTHRRIIIFSPHPDDDVICMGGTLMKLIAQGHDVYVVYMVSGFLSVFDHDVLRYAQFTKGFNDIFGLSPDKFEVIEKQIGKLLGDKCPGDVDSPQIQALKGLIRKTEAINAATFCGVDKNHIFFLDMPFYNTGKVQKLSLGDDDVKAVRNILETVKPEIIFAAGDMSDPHGTHRLCQEAGLKALEQYVSDGNKQPELWLYRGAWQEWEPELIDMVVPLSPDELKNKRFAIFRHESQKDKAMFPGPYDSREFWQRAEERAMATAAIYDALGMPEYHALEAFVHYPLSISTYVQKELIGK